MKSSTRLHVLSAILSVVLFGCGVFGESFEEDVDCGDECDKQNRVCSADLGTPFDYETYEADCEAAPPDFCDLAETGDCLEPDFDIEEATIAGVHHALKSGEISCEWLTRRYLDRILWHDLYLDDGDPPLNAFVHLNDRAVETARMLDEYQQCEGELAGPLHCVPFGIKSNFASKEVPVTHGSLALEDPQPTFDAYTVERLREAGAVNLGSTSMDEFAAGAQGLSGRTGKSANPYNRYRTPGGSSSGSGIAPAANLAMGALGTDNCSSLTIPAAYNGLATIRSSHQLLSTDGIFPTNRLDAVAGPMARTVEDMTRLFDEMAAFNPEYGPHCRQGIEHDESYLDALDEDGLQGKRLGVLEQAGADSDEERLPFDDGDDELDEYFDEMFDELTDAGAELVEGIELDELSFDRRGTGSGYDANRFLEHTEGGVSNYDELCHTEKYSHFVFETQDDCLDRGDQSDRQLQSNLESGLEDYRERRAYVEDVMDDYDVDALIYPADRRGGARRAYTASLCVVYSVTGLPTAVVPSGFDDDGMPLGLAFTGRMFDDAELIELAYAYEQATEHRAPPELPTFDSPPPIDIEEFEQLHYELGLEAFEQVLIDSDKYDLEPGVFLDITRQTLEDAGLDDKLAD